jgi:predicted phosphodiesterase
MYVFDMLFKPGIIFLWRIAMMRHVTSAIIPLIILFLLTGALLSTPSLAAEDTLKFVVWGDSQFHNTGVFERLVRETELLKPAFVVQAGDLIHGYTYDPEKARREWTRFKKQIKPLSCPYYPVPGNHDVTTREIEPVYGEVWGSDKYYYSFDCENIHFIVLDTYLHQQYDTIPPQEMEWLKNDLEKNKSAGHIFIAFHSPLHMNDKYDWESVHALLKQYPVRGVFTGHSHIYDYRIRDGIHYFCLNTSGLMTMYSHLLGRSHHFVIVNVEKDNVAFAVKTDDRILPPDAVPPDAYKKGSRYLKDEQTIIIPDPSRAAIQEKISIPLENKTKKTRDFHLVWERYDTMWKVEPCEERLALQSGERKEVVFSISSPRHATPRNQLPRLRIDSPYENERGYKTTLTYYHRLFYPPETLALPLEGNLMLDGKIEEDAWRKAPAINRLFLDSEETPAAEKTEVRVLYDDSCLYVAIRGEEPNPSGMAAYAHGDVPLVFGDDDFELFFDTNRDLSTYFRLMTNSKETVLNSGPEGLFSFTFDVKAHVGQDFWSAEFKVPFDEFKVEKPGEGEVWGFNVRRHRQQNENPQSDWSKMRNFPYQPQYFGLLRFQ